jgi:hypothetical protein
MSTPTNNWRLRRTEHRFYAEIVTDIATRNSERKNTGLVHANCLMKLLGCSDSFYKV